MGLKKRGTKIKDKKKEMLTFNAVGFQEGVPFVQSLYNRISNPSLTAEETKTYLQRLQRLKTSCNNDLRCLINYPPVAEQHGMQDYVVEVTMDQNRATVKKRKAVNDLEDAQLPPEKIALVKQKRANAVIIFTPKGCRATEVPNILASNHYEILFVIAISRDIAMNVLNMLLAMWKDNNLTESVFAEVPRSWDDFFLSAGFKQYPYETFGTLLPKHSFLHTWVLTNLQNEKQVPAVFETSSQNDLKFPNDPDMKTIDLPPAQTGFLFGLDPYPTDIQQATVRFNEDYTAMLNYGRSAQGQIALTDAEGVRQVLQRMFAFARLAAKNPIWRQMIEVEQLFTEYGIVSEPSTQTMYNDIVRRNDANEMLTNIWVMRSFASMFPRFTQQQINLEKSFLQPLMDANGRAESRKWIVANLSQPSDFAALNPFSEVTLKAVHGRMVELRGMWKGRVTTIAKSIKTLEGQVKLQGDKKQDAPEVAPIVALQKRATEIVQNAKDVENTFQQTLSSVVKNSNMDKTALLMIQDWDRESKSNVESLQQLAFDTQSSFWTPENSELSIAEKATSLVNDLVTASKDSIAKTGETASDVPGMTFKTATADEQSLAKMMQEFNANFEQLKQIETNRKAEIRGKMRTLAAEGLGIRNSIKELADSPSVPDLSPALEKERKTLFDLARGCELQLQASISNPMFRNNDTDPDKESLVSEQDLVNLHNMLVSQRECLERYYQSIQLLDKRIQDQNGAKALNETRQALQSIMNFEKKADVALSEAQMLLANAKQSAFDVDIRQMENGIAQMSRRRADMRQLHQDLDATLQPQAAQFPKTIRNEKVDNAKKILEDIVRELLMLQQTVVAKTEQFRLLHAALENNKNLTEALKNSKESARLAEKHKNDLVLAERTTAALNEKMAVVASPLRKTTASFENLNEQAKSMTQKHQIALMQLVQKLRQDMDTPKTTTNDIETDIRAISAYMTKHEESLRQGDFSAEKEHIEDAVRNAQDVLRTRKAHYQKAQLAWEKSKDKMQHVSELLSELKIAVRERQPDFIRSVLHRLHEAKFTEVYDITDDVMHLFERAKKIIQKDKRAAIME